MGNPVIAAVVIGLPATLIKSISNALLEDPARKGETLSYTVDEARSRGTLVCELEVSPRELRIGNTIVQFREAWLEERALATHFLIWLPYNKRVGGYSLCFSLRHGETVVQQSHMFFVVDDSGQGVAESHSVYHPTLYVWQLDHADVSAHPMSLVSSWKDERMKNIRFVRKSDGG